MKKIMLITLLLCSLGVVPLGCASEPESVSQNQMVTVQRGNLTVDITASGNLALSVTQDLAFEIAGTTANPLTVAEVLVEEGESVEKGQVLARADTSAWQDQLTSLERAVTNTKRTVTQKQLDLLGKQISLNSAQQALEQAEQGTTTTSTGDIRTTTTDPLDIEMKQLQLELAQGNLELAQIAVADAQTAVDDAEKALKDAQDASPEVTAPFAGFITTVSVSGGDEVKKGTVAVTLADPNKFEADILVSEMDIPQVKVGGDAAVTVSAMSGLSLPAKVTHISPTATIQSGVVNYRVKVEVESLETIMQQRQQATQQAQQQAGQQGQGQQGTQRQQTPAGQQQIPTTVPAAVSQTIQLRQGLTITVSIIVDQRTDVLLVPNGAVTTRGRQTYVQVSLPDGTTAERAITTGISDWQYTEVTDGLSEGEQVVVPQGTTTTTTTTKQQQGRQGPETQFFFGP